MGAARLLQPTPEDQPQRNDARGQHDQVDQEPGGKLRQVEPEDFCDVERDEGEQEEIEEREQAGFHAGEIRLVAINLVELADVGGEGPKHEWAATVAIRPGAAIQITISRGG